MAGTGTGDSELPPRPGRAAGPFRSLPLLLVVLHVLSFVAAAHAASRAGGGGGVLLALAFSVLVVRACQVDALRRGDALPRGLAYGMVMLWPVVVPAYLVQTRGGRGLLWAALWTTTLLLAAGAGVVYMAVQAALRR